MTDEQLAAIEARADAVPSGPWLYRSVDDVRLVRVVRQVESGARWPIADCSGAPYGEQRRALAEFIAHTRDDVPALVVEVRRLRSCLTARDSVC